MCVVAARLALEVAAVTVIVFIVFGHKTLVASPSLSEDFKLSNQAKFAVKV
jgi:hypothetical protein